MHTHTILAPTKKLLIIDDDNLLLKLYELEIQMRNRDVRVSTAENGLEAIEAIERSTPDLILLDLRLPKADGFAVLKHMQERAVLTPVLIVTNYDKSEYRELCREYAIVQEYLLKRGIAIRDLVQKMEDYLFGKDEVIGD